MSIQPFSLRLTGIDAVFTYYASVFGYFSAAVITESTVQSIAGVSGTLLITGGEIAAAPGAGTSFTLTIRVNGVNTGHSITFAGTSTIGTISGSAVAINAGDLVVIVSSKTGSPTPGDMYVNINFDSTTTGQYQYGGIVNGTISSAGTRLTSLFNGSAVLFNASHKSVVAVAGNITGHQFKLNGDPTPATLVAYIDKNGVRQDGTSGTPDTRVTIGPGQTSGSNTAFSLSVVEGDILELDIETTGIPTTARRAGNAFRFEPTNPSTFIIVGDINASSTPNAGVTAYWPLVNNGPHASNATESNVYQRYGNQALILQKIYAQLNLAPGGTNVYTLRQNGQDLIALSSSAASWNFPLNVNLRAASLIAMKVLGGTGSLGRTWSYAIAASIGELPPAAVSTLDSSGDIVFFQSVTTVNGTVSVVAAVSNRINRITWQVNYDSAPGTAQIFMEGSLDNQNWAIIDTSTNTAGEIREFNSSAKFIRVRVGTMDSNRTVTVTTRGKGKKR